MWLFINNVWLQWCPGLIFLPDYWDKSEDFWDSILQYSYHLSHLRMFLLWSPQIYSIIPIFQVELNSIQTIEVVSVIWVFRDHPRNVSISSSQSSEHYLKRLRQSGWSCGNQALRSQKTNQLLTKQISLLPLAIWVAEVGPLA